MVECNCLHGYDETYHCKKCNCCCFGDLIIGEPQDEYLDPGRCGQCAMNDGMTIPELVSIIDRM